METTLVQAGNLSDRQIILTSVKKLKPYERNARTHSAKQIQQIINSIKQFGFTNPILVGS